MLERIIKMRQKAILIYIKNIINQEFSIDNDYNQVYPTNDFPKSFKIGLLNSGILNSK